MKNSKNLTNSLLKWYDSNKRDLAWRQEPITVYKVWLSEIMLQQASLVSGVYWRVSQINVLSVLVVWVEPPK